MLESNYRKMFLDEASLEEFLDLLVVPHPHLVLDVRLLNTAFNKLCKRSQKHRGIYSGQPAKFPPSLSQKFSLFLRTFIKSSFSPPCFSFFEKFPRKWGNGQKINPCKNMWIMNKVSRNLA